MFLSDYGLDDEFVGIVHRVIQTVAPAVRVVDLTHGIRPQDVRSGALTLWRCAPWLHDAVVLAVVDPGVGTPRRPVAIEVAETGTVLVGPDNGLLLPSAHALGRVTSAVRLGPARPTPNAPVGLGSTFDGRDLFSPVAARIAAGGLSVRDAGDPIDPAGLTGRPVPAPVAEGKGSVLCEVLWVDHFGNAQLNAGPADVAHLGDRVRVTRRGGDPFEGRVVSAFGEIGDGEVGLVIDSYGLLALAFNGSPAAARLGIGEGDSVRIGPAADG